MFEEYKKIKKNKGFTYVELIVVLSIFAIMSSLILFNYNAYQANVDIKVLANDIALKIVQAQKDAMDGRLNVNATDPNWKPSYGVYFDTTNPGQFEYFADYNNNKIYDTSENLLKIDINKGDNIKDISYYSTDNNSWISGISGDLNITFTRPDSKAVFNLNNSNINSASAVQIAVASPEGSNQAVSCIQVYASGRIQIGQCKNTSTSEL